MNPVVEATPLFNNNLSFGDAQKDFLVQTFVSQTVMKTLHMPILPWTAWLNIDRAYSHLSKSLLNLPSDELWTVVTAQILGNPAPSHHLSQGVEHLATSQFTCHLDLQTFSTVFVDQGQHLQ